MQPHDPGASRHSYKQGRVAEGRRSVYSKLTCQGRSYSSRFFLFLNFSGELHTLRFLRLIKEIILRYIPRSFPRDYFLLVSSFFSFPVLEEQLGDLELLEVSRL